jgi:hypothetical protein
MSDSDDTHDPSACRREGASLRRKADRRRTPTLSQPGLRGITLNVARLVRHPGSSPRR